MTVYLLCLILFLVGVYCILVKRNLIKIIIGIAIMEYAVNLMFILFGYRAKGRAPFFSEGQIVRNMVDPLPQALVITAIVIGLGVTAVIITMAVRLYEKYGTFDITHIRKLKG